MLGSTDLSDEEFINEFMDFFKDIITWDRPGRKLFKEEMIAVVIDAIKKWQPTPECNNPVFAVSNINTVNYSVKPY